MAKSKTLAYSVVSFYEPKTKTISYKHSFIHLTNPFVCLCRVSAGWVFCDVCSNPALKTCLTCGDSYCMTCIRPHYSDPDLERHQLQDLQDQSLCEQHHKQLTYYCRTDQSAICSRCFLTDHKGHDVVEQVGTRTDQVWFFVIIPRLG